MNKKEFLAELGARLSGLPQEDIDERLCFYGEMIDDRIEENVSEEESVAQIGSVDDVVSQILMDYPLKKIVMERVKPRRRLRVWEIILLILGAPMWLPILLSIVVVFIAVYVVLWAVIIALWAVEAAFIVSVPGGLMCAVIALTRGNALSAMAAAGVSVCCAGLAIFMFFACKAATKGIAFLTKRLILGVKTMFVGKEASK